MGMGGLQGTFFALGLAEYLNVIQISYKPKYSRVEDATRILNEEESDVVAEDLSGDRYKPDSTYAYVLCENPFQKAQAAEQNSSAKLDPESLRNCQRIPL